MTSRVLDVGCGNKKLAGAIGIDRVFLPNVDVVCDLDVLPLPFGDNTFGRIVCNHIVEHVENLLDFMQEVHRVGEPGATVEIVTPHFTNRFSYTDPTHLRHLSLRSFDYFMPDESGGALKRNFFQRVFETQYAVSEFSFYSTARFRKNSAHFSMARPFRLLGIAWLMNRCGDFYELYLAFMLPARDLYFRLQVIK